jgi:uncharacterized OB-fold protein
MSQAGESKVGTDKKRIPFREGLFTMPASSSEKPRLIGCRCRSCGTYFYPRRRVCLNCQKREMEQVLLSPRGKLHTFTVFRQAPASGIMVPPYAVGQIELPEGVNVTSVLTGSDFESLDIGMDMEMVLEEVTKDQEGNGLIAYKFTPVKS